MNDFYLKYVRKFLVATANGSKPVINKFKDMTEAYIEYERLRKDKSVVFLELRQANRIIATYSVK